MCSIRLNGHFHTILLSRGGSERGSTHKRDRATSSNTVVWHRHNGQLHVKIETAITLECGQITSIYNNSNVNMSSTSLDNVERKSHK